MFIMFHPYIAGSLSSTGLYTWTLPFHPVYVSLKKYYSATWLLNSFICWVRIWMSLLSSPLLSYRFSVFSYSMIWNARMNVSSCMMYGCSPTPFSSSPTSLSISNPICFWFRSTCKVPCWCMRSDYPVSSGFCGILLFFLCLCVFQ